jgi:hypothetical protein
MIRTWLGPDACPLLPPLRPQELHTFGLLQQVRRGIEAAHASCGPLLRQRFLPLLLSKVQELHDQLLSPPSAALESFWLELLRKENAGCLSADEAIATFGTRFFSLQLLAASASGSSVASFQLTYAVATALSLPLFTFDVGILAGVACSRCARR